MFAKNDSKNQFDRGSVVASGEADGMGTTRQRMKCFDTPRKQGYWCFGFFCILLSVAIILGVSIKKVDSTEYGVMYNVHSKQLDAAILSGGLHVGPPG